jgi:hypothetical protein
VSDDREEAEGLRRLLGSPPEVLIPPGLDDRVLAAAQGLLQPVSPRARRAGPPALAWVLVIGTELVAAAVGLSWPPRLALPCQPEPLFCVAAAAYLLTLLTTPLILIRRINGGIHHG